MPDRNNSSQNSPAPEPPENRRPDPSGEERSSGSSGRSNRNRRWRPRSSSSRPNRDDQQPAAPTGVSSETAPKPVPSGDTAQNRPGRRRRSRGGRQQDNRQNNRPAGDNSSSTGQQAGDRRDRPRSQPGQPVTDRVHPDGARDSGRSGRRGRSQPKSNQRENTAGPNGQPGDQRSQGRANTSTGSRHSQQPATRKPGRGPRPGSKPAGYHPPPTIPIKARGGIKARSEGENFGKNWWAKRWLVAMERLMDGARLQRGRRYARMGQILSMNESGGGIVARVQGSRPQPYKVAIRITPFSDEQWEKILDVLADQAIFTAQLLAGEMPANIEDAFAAAGVSLFPARGGDLMTECSCPDWANPCKHIAATHYILGDRFDEDPFLIFRLRGRSQEQILQALRQRRSGQLEIEEEEPTQEEEAAAPLDQQIDRFWEIGAQMENFSVIVQAPTIALPLLKRLGDLDAAGRISLEETLGPAYEAMSQFALMLAFSDISRENGENGQE